MYTLQQIIDNPEACLNIETLVSLAKRLQALTGNESLYNVGTEVVRLVSQKPNSTHVIVVGGIHTGKSHILSMINDSLAANGANTIQLSERADSVHQFIGSISDGDISAILNLRPLELNEIDYNPSLELDAYALQDVVDKAFADSSKAFSNATMMMRDTTQPGWNKIRVTVSGVRQSGKTSVLNTIARALSGLDNVSVTNLNSDVDSCEIDPATLDNIKHPCVIELVEHTGGVETITKVLQLSDVAADIKNAVGEMPSDLVELARVKPPIEPSVLDVIRKYPDHVHIIAVGPVGIGKTLFLNAVRDYLMLDANGKGVISAYSDDCTETAVTATGFYKELVEEAFAKGVVLSESYYYAERDQLKAITREGGGALVRGQGSVDDLVNPIPDDFGPEYLVAVLEKIWADNPTITLTPEGEAIMKGFRQVVIEGKDGEDVMETLFWEYNNERSKTGQERYTFKNMVRGFLLKAFETGLAKYETLKQTKG